MKSNSGKHANRLVIKRKGRCPVSEGSFLYRLGEKYNVRLKIDAVKSFVPGRTRLERERRRLRKARIFNDCELMPDGDRGRSRL